MSQSEIEKAKRIIRFFHPEKRFGFMPGANDADALAKIFGVSKSNYLAIKEEFDLNVNLTARELLNEAGYASDIEGLAIRPGTKIAVIGDSLTDDYQSWFEIIQKSLSIARPELDLQWFNTALSGDTSMQLFSTLTHIEKIQPDYLFCLIGTNDARVHGQGMKSCTGFREVIDNLSEIATRAKASIEQEFIWITPVGVKESWIKKDWLLTQFDASWSNEQICEIAELIRTRPEHHIDIAPLFAGMNSESFFLEDGLHWSLAGQKAVARAVMTGFNRTISEKS